MEVDPDARATLAHNRPDWPQHPDGDVVALARDPEAISPSWCGTDLIVAGPPCQPFSKAAQWTPRGRALKDPRSDTVRALFRLIGRLEPNAVLIENVPGFIRGKHAALPLLTRYLRRLEDSGGPSYRISARVLDSADFGVPQHRVRAIVVITKGPREFVWPEPTNAGKPVTAWTAIGDIGVIDPPPLSGGYAALLPSIPEGSNYQWHTPGGGGEPLFGRRTRYWSFLLKLAKNRPAWTVSAQPGPSTGPFHWDNRPLATAELLRLQSFPDDWTVSGSRAAIQRQIGNATPPRLAMILASAIRAHLTGCQSGPHEPIPNVSAPSPRKVEPVPAHFGPPEHPPNPHPGPGLGPGALRLKDLSQNS